jgi:hypothetical protein
MKRLCVLGFAPLVAASAFAALAADPPRPPDVVAVDEPAPGAPVPWKPSQVDVLEQRMKKADPPARTEARDMDPTSAVYKAQAEVIAAQHDYERQKQQAAGDRLREAKAKLAAALAPER